MEYYMKNKIIYSLLDYLADNHQPDEQWQDWYITPITGGLNNLLYRTTNSEYDLAIKFTIRDSRNRADREYGALLALHQAGLSIAPQPVLLDRDRYSQPVVVQTWLEGEAVTTPPPTDTEWECLLQHLATLHTLTPAKTSLKLPEAVLNANSIQEGKKIIQQQIALIPSEAQPTSLKTLTCHFETATLPRWSKVPVALCRVDANCLNFIRRPGLWASVDWENSGWGDPAFEIADLMTHPAYISVPPSRWEWVVDTYCHLIGDASTAIRIQTYYKIMLVWWVARAARYVYEFSQESEKRLATLPDDWEATVRANYHHYLDLAQNFLKS
jgi:aminoglycoside phosphotransferase (APT) family kinase protein